MAFDAAVIETHSLASSHRDKAFMLCLMHLLTGSLYLVIIAMKQ